MQRVCTCPGGEARLKAMRLALMLDAATSSAVMTPTKDTPQQTERLNLSLSQMAHSLENQMNPKRVYGSYTIYPNKGYSSTGYTVPILGFLWLTGELRLLAPAASACPADGSLMPGKATRSSLSRPCDLKAGRKTCRNFIESHACMPCVHATAMSMPGSWCRKAESRVRLKLSQAHHQSLKGP